LIKFDRQDARFVSWRVAILVGSRSSSIKKVEWKEGKRMPATVSWPRALLIVGLTGMLLGAIDPLEGSLIILPGSGLVALGGRWSRPTQAFSPTWFSTNRSLRRSGE
jgi:hypothetical protein